MKYLSKIIVAAMAVCACSLVSVAGQICTFNGGWDNTPANDDDAIVVTSGNLTWGSPLPLKVASWSQSGGTVTFDTGLDEFEVTGDVSITGGTWTHTANPSCNSSSDAWKSGRGTKQLIVKCGGDFTLGADASINVKAKGFTYAQGPGTSSSGGGGHGGSGQVQAQSMYSSRYPGKCYGSVKCPNTIGSGGSGTNYGTRGGGAVHLTVAGRLTLNGPINADAGDTNDSGGNCQYYSGAGGGVWLSAAEIVGSGDISVKGGNVTNQGGGGAGRVALYVTGNGKDFSDYTGDVSFACCAKSDVAPFTGTLYRETAADAGKGELWVKGYDANTSWINDAWKEGRESGTRICDTDGPVQLKAICLTGHALLAIPSNVVVEADSIISVNDGAWTNKIELVGGTLKMPASYELSGVKLVLHYPGSDFGFMAADPQTRIIGSGGHLVIDIPYTAHGDVVLRNGGRISHTRGNDTYHLDLTVPGNLTIDAGGLIDVTGCGYANDTGPGKSTVGSSGASHGGLGSGGATAAKRPFGGDGACYGSIRCPHQAGSGGKWNNNGTTSYGGGVIRLNVSGTIANNGAVRADGGLVEHYSGSGGSVWMTADRLTGAGIISANGGKVTTGQWEATGGGGRVAVYISNASNDFSEYFGTITAYGGTKNGNVYAGAGTVYLKSGAEAANGGRLIISNGATPGYSTTRTRIDSLVTDTDVGTVEISPKTQLYIADGQTLTVGNAWTNNGVFVAEAGSTVALVPSGTSVTVSGDNSFYNLTSLAAGKTILFDTVDSQTSIQAGGTLDLKGAENNVLTLDAIDGVSSWKIVADAATIQSLEYLQVNNSDASDGAKIVAEKSSGDNCLNWNFSNVIPGQVNTWTGENGTSWTDADNWDLGRTPKETDNIVIAAAANQPQAGTDIEAWSLTVQSGARLDLNGYSVSVTNLTVNGHLVCSGSERLTVMGSASFAASSFTAVKSVLSFVGSGNRSFDAGGNTFYDLYVNLEGGTMSVSDNFMVERLFARTDFGAYTMSFDAGLLITAKEARFLGNRGGSAAIALQSSTAGSRWSINVSDYTVANGVNVQDSNATGLGFNVSQPGSCSNSPGWTMGGESCVWTGNADADFSNADNWQDGRVPTSPDTVSFTAAATVVVTSDVSIANLDLGGGSDAVTFTVNAPLTVSGTVLVGDNATLVLNRPTTVSNAFIVADGGVVTHSANITEKVNSIELTVNGNMTIDEGGCLDVVGKGHSKGKGLGAKGVSQAGPSYGGRGGTTGGQSVRIASSYGSVFQPTDLGSGGTDSANFGTPGGGAVRLVVNGELKVDGVINASGKDDIVPQVQQGESCYYSGTGGSIWITVGSLTGDGEILADGGKDRHGYTGGGGRVAVYLTSADAIAFTGALTAHGGNLESSTEQDIYARAGAGTIYEQGASTATGHGQLVIDNCRPNYAYYGPSYHVTDLPVTNGVAETARELRNITLVLKNYAVLNLVSDLEIAELEVYPKARINLNGHCLTVVSRVHKDNSNKNGWNWNLDLDSTGGSVVFKKCGTILLVK